MTSLQTYHVEDWAKYLEENEIDLQCPTCKDKLDGCEDCGALDACEDCSGSGYIEPLWNTVWNTGFRDTGENGQFPRESGSVFAFVKDSEIWFGLTCCGMDCTPFLAKAWLECFSDCPWLPEQFCVEGCNLRGGYVESCVGPQWARRIYRVMGSTVKMLRLQATRLAADLKEARKRLVKKPAK